MYLAGDPASDDISTFIWLCNSPASLIARIVTANQALGATLHVTFR